MELDLQNITLLLIIILVCLTVVYLIQNSKTSSRLPPGPLKLPILGSYMSMKFPFRKWLPECHKEYNSGIISFKMAGHLWVSISSLEILQEAFVKNSHLFSGRPQNLWSKNILKSGGLVMGEGAQWKSHKNLSLRLLRNLGLQKRFMEKRILFEIDELINILSNKKGELVDSSAIFAIPTCNLISSLVFGERLASENSEFKRLLNNVTEILQKDVYSSFGTTVIMPLVVKFCPRLLFKIPRVQVVMNNINSVISFCKSMIQKQKDEMCNNNNYLPSNFIQAILAESEKTGDNNIADVERLAITVFDLFIAGTETTCNTLTWIFLYLAKYSSIQEELYKKVLEQSSNKVKSNDAKSQIPLLEAIVHEIFRLHPVLPTAVTHRTTRDSYIKGYFIPEGTHVLPNLSIIHRNPAVFKNPETFNPKRFIDENENFKPSAHVLPFSLGRRVCIGESLAMLELYLITSSIIKHFSVSVQYSESISEEDIFAGTFGFANAPLTFNFKFQKRE